MCSQSEHVAIIIPHLPYIVALPSSHNHCSHSSSTRREHTPCWPLAVKFIEGRRRTIARPRGGRNTYVTSHPVSIMSGRSANFFDHRFKENESLRPRDSHGEP